MWLDIAIAATLAVLTIAMAYLGVHVTLHPAESTTTKNLYKIGFSACAFGAVSLVIWQGIRNGQSQSSLAHEVMETRNEARGAHDVARQARQDLTMETARRQQAEKDLASTIQGTGMATRQGVVADIKSSPIRVDISGPARKPMAVENMKMFTESEPSTYQDAPYAMKITLQADTTVSNFALNIVFSHAIKHVETKIRDGAEFYGSIQPLIADHKTLSIYVKSVGAALLNTDSPLVIHVSSDSPLSVVKFLRGPNP